MAVDTRDKRFSMIGMVAPTRIEQQNPTGTIGLPARQMLLHAYSGIAFSNPAAVTPGAFTFFRLIAQAGSF